MASLTDPRKEQFAQAVAFGSKLSPAYRAAYDTQAIPSTIWTAASELRQEVAPRINELRAALEVRAENDPAIISQLRLLQELTEVWEKPVEAMGPDCQFVQKYKRTTNPLTGDITESIEPLSKLGAADKIIQIRGYAAPIGPQSVTINNNLTVNNPALLEDKARALAAQFALPTRIIEAETTEV